VTGDGYPDVLFETDPVGGSRCCPGTIVYNLGPEPVQVLGIITSPDYYDGRGEFQDLDGDGRYEFITRDALRGIPCSTPTVKVILQYEPGRGYVGASPRFAAFYADEIARHTQEAEAAIEQSRTGYKCAVYALVADYLYAGQPDQAWAELNRLYLGPDLEEFRSLLEQAVRAGRFFAPTTAP
jgi:hypothetical protein